MLGLNLKELFDNIKALDEKYPEVNHAEKLEIIKKVIIFYTQYITLVIKYQNL